jgi:arabinose-5-phosphate isomerase
LDIADDKLRALGRAVLETEAEAVAHLMARVDEPGFAAACRHMLACEGRVVVLGMGKSGHIGGKLAATLASTGTPAFFIHPGEASHGDIGMITAKDVVLALSNSGETDEVLVLLPLIKRMGVPLIALTGNANSNLAKAADVHIDVSVEKEACPLGLAPTASTTAALAMGDALAIALLQARGFSADDFALAHPGGTLGRRLLVRISDVMRTGDDLPMVGERATLSEVVIEMTRKRLGMTAIVDERKRLLGIFTDYDLRHALESGADVHTTLVTAVMNRDCKTVTPDALAAEGLRIMEKHKINALLAVDVNRTLVGALNMHDLLQARVM